jgi:tetratricopeptide (TPR) repeat protein
VPGDFHELIEHAVGLCEAGKFEEAADLLRRVVERDRLDAAAWELLARCELGAERYESAVDAARRASDLSLESSVPHQIASLALLSLDRPGQAVIQARDAVRVDPFDWRALATLARVLVAAGSDGSEPRELVVRMLRLAPNEPEAHQTAGVVASAIGNTEEAKASFLKVLELDPSSAPAQHELARLRLHRRVNDPAALADAAAGFARAARAEPRSDRSRQRLDLVLRVFLSKTAYLLLIDAYLVGRISASADGVVARLLPPMLLLIPAFYGWRFMSRLTPPSLRCLREAITGKGPLRVAFVAETTAVLAILSGALAPQSLRPGMAGLAAVCALAGRVVIYTQVEHASRAVQRQPARPAISSSMLWVIALLLFLTAAALLVAAAKDNAGSGAIVGAAIFAGCAASVIGFARSRRRGSA